MTRWSLALLVLLPACAAAQQAEPPNGLLLVAKPGLLDPNFRQTVVLVTQTPDSQTVGVILNRPTQLKLSQLLPENAVPPIDYILSSPPYWDMLHVQGAQTQRNRRQSALLDVFYSDDPEDLGNISDYNQFLERLTAIYKSLQPFLKTGAYLTIIVKNIKKRGRIYPLAWDLAARLGHTYTLKDERIWCQNDQRLAPFGLGSAWVSNTFHHYCLQFRNERTST